MMAISEDARIHKGRERGRRQDDEEPRGILSQKGRRGLSQNQQVEGEENGCIEYRLSYEDHKMKGKSVLLPSISLFRF